MVAKDLRAAILRQHRLLASYRAALPFVSLRQFHGSATAIKRGCYGIDASRHDRKCVLIRRVPDIVTAPAVGLVSRRTARRFPTRFGRSPLST